MKILPKPVLSLALATLLTVVGASNALADSLRRPAQIPVVASIGIPPNVMFIIDDSGSMAWGYMPDNTSSYYNSNVYKNSEFNRVYYDPEVEYALPVGPDGEEMDEPSFTAAFLDGYEHYLGQNSNTLDLSKDFKPSRTSKAPSVGTKQPAYYYVRNYNGWSCSDPESTSNECYDKVVVSATSGPGGADERQNFANWFSYYRTRMFASRAAIGRAFAELPDHFRLGWGRINKSTLTNVDGNSVNTIQQGVRQMNFNHKDNFYNWLYAVNPTGGTPLRRALDAAGKYYTNDSTSGPWGDRPGSGGGEIAECRQSFTILMSDGYRNGSLSNGPENSDNESGPIIYGPDGQSYQYTPSSPFKDGYSDTLADVAMKYWKKDLLPDVENRVPTNDVNPAFWQHMSTYTIGLGVQGSINEEDAWAAVETGDSINWPYTGPPTSQANQYNEAKIDDMLHAAINGRGGFFAANDPNSFAQELSEVLQDIIARTSATSSSATDSVRMDGDSLSYAATYDSAGWVGELIGETFDGEVTITASDALADHGARNIYTYDGGGGIEFNADALSGLQASIMEDAPDSWGFSELVDYLRGSGSLEGSLFRERESKIGDIIGSGLVFSGSGNEGWGAIDNDNGKYLEYIETTKNDPRDCSDDPGCSGGEYKRHDTVFVGANDGMLHAFDGRTLEEHFAYIPSMLHSRLYKLADPDYEHEFYVDGQVDVGDAYISGSWKTILVGTLGAGGKGVFALDVTDPKNFTASDVLWEIDGADEDSEFYGKLGYTYGKPAITRLESGEWVAIFGNGYYSGGDSVNDEEDDRASLLVVSLEDGELIHEVELGGNVAGNGLSGVSIWEDPNSRTFVRRVYAGDLNGTLWRVDFNNGNPEVSSSMSEGLFQTQGNQPITISPVLGDNPAGGVMVFFGTGQLFESGDELDASVQALYGILDVNNSVDFGQLAKNKINRSLGIIERESGSSDHGWYVNLEDDTNERGERVIYSPDLRFGVLAVGTTTPSDDACIPGSRDRVYVLDALSGVGDGVELGEGESISTEIVIIPPDPKIPDDDPTRGGDSDGSAPSNPSEPPELDSGDLKKVGWCSKIALIKKGSGSNNYEVLGEICDGRNVWREF